jgi:putative ABC transport system permease protein
MIFSNAFLIALREIRRNLSRAFLTVLGIIIGIAAVITSFTLGEGATAAVKQEFANFGTNLLTLRPGLGMGPRAPGTPNFSEDDVDAIARVANVTFAIPVRSSSQVTRFLHNARNTSVTGSSLAYFEINRWQIAEGRFFNNTEEKEGAAVCLIGSTAARELFEGTRENPVGSVIKIGNIACKIIGTLQTKGQVGRWDADDTIITPLLTLQRRITGRVTMQDIDSINIAIREDAETAGIITDLNRLMRTRRKLAPSQENNFFVMDPKQFADSMRNSTELLTSLFAVIAGVSLLVGGIGIMNIMLVSVTERTREIGIRMSIGARSREVLLQFLIEAVTLAAAGGLAGVVLAGVVGNILAVWLNFTYIFNPQINIVAVVFSALIGIVFGYMPARRAAGLDPIEALRRE